MATLTISLSGSAIVTGSKSYTISDADLQALLTWAAAHYDGSLPASPTNQQVLLAWIQDWISRTRNQVQSAQMIASQPPLPPQISIS